MALHGNAKDRHERVRRRHARQMGGAARAGDNHFDPAPFGFLGKLGHQVRRAMGRHDPALVRNAKLRQHGVGVPHRLPVRFASHDDRDQRIG